MDKFTTETIKAELKKRALVLSFIPFVVIGLIAVLVALTSQGSDNGNMFKEYYDSKVIEFASENNYLSDVDIAFIGDSITDGYEQFGTAYSQYKVAWRGIGGDTTTGVYNRLDVSLYAVNPKVIVLLIGVNNLESMFTDYEKIITDIRTKLPDAKLIVQSLHPTSKDFADRNPDIIDANVRVKEICERNGCTYVDMYTQLVNADGVYSEAYTDDGLHPNEEGYKKITEILLPVITEKLK